MFAAHAGKIYIMEHQIECFKLSLNAAEKTPGFSQNLEDYVHMPATGRLLKFIPEHMVGCGVSFKNHIETEAEEWGTRNKAEK